MITPDFIIIGAMKAGTTSLYQHLDAHPEIGMSRLKETDFFISEKNYSRGVSWYSNQFEPGMRLYGEASPNYTKARDFRDVPARIASLLPEVKLIYALRDPVDRAVSQYTHSYLMGALKQSPDALVGSHEWEHILDASRYGAQLDAYLARFHPEQILILDFDELTRATATALGRVGAFLGVEDLTPAPETGAANSAGDMAATPPAFYAARRLGVTDLVRPMIPATVERRLKSLLARVKRRQAPKFAPELRARIAEELRDDIASFRARTGLRFQHWSV